MTVIDYLSVSGEVRPNVLLSQTKKCIISKVMACITVFYSKYTWINSRITTHWHAREHEHAHAGRAVLTATLAVFLLWLCFRDGPLRTGVSVCSVHMSRGVFVWCTAISMATTITPGLRDSVPETRLDKMCRHIWMHVSFISLLPNPNYSKHCTITTSPCAVVSDPGPSVKRVLVEFLHLVVFVFRSLRPFPWRFSPFSCHYNSITSMASLPALWCWGVPCHPCWGDLCSGSCAN